MEPGENALSSYHQGNRDVGQDGALATTHTGIVLWPEVKSSWLPCFLEEGWAGSASTGSLLCLHEHWSQWESGAKVGEPCGCF